MAEVKISALPAADAATGAELIEVVQGGNSKKMALTSAVANSGSALDARFGPKATAGGVRFDGNNSSATLSTSIQLASAVNTISVKLQASYVNGIRQTIIASGTAAAGLTSGFNFYISEAVANRIDCALYQLGTTTIHYLKRFESIPLDDAHTYTFVIDNTGSPSIELYVDGVLIGGSVITSATGTFDDSSAVVFRVGQGTATQTLRGNASNLALFNRALTAAEVATLYRDGLAAIPALGGFGAFGNAILDVSRNSDFSAGATDWTGGTADAVDGELDLTLAGFAASNLTSSFAVLPRSGETWRATFSITKYSSGSITLRNGGGTAQNIIVNQNTTGVKTADFIADSNFSQWQMIAGSGGFTGSISQIVFEKIGCTAALPIDEGIGRQLRDRSGNGYHAFLSATGYSHLLPEFDWSIQRANQNFSTDGVWIEAGDIIPANTVITGFIADGKYVPVSTSVNQTLTHRRLHVASATPNTLTISRTAGTSASTTLATITVTSDASVDFAVLGRQINV